MKTAYVFLVLTALLPAGAAAESLTLDLNLDLLDFGRKHPPAPAPLLAAGVPAFAALGGGALASRLLRRRRGASKDAAVPSGDADSP